MKRTWVVFLAIAAAVAAGGYAWHTVTRPQTLRVVVTHWYGFLPLWLGRDRGIFERHGIRLEPTIESDSTKMKADLVSGRADLIGTSVDDLVVAAGQGLMGRVVLVTDTSQGADGIVADRSIKDVAGLRGRKIAVQPGFVNHFMLLSTLELAGLTGKDVAIVPTEPQLAGEEFLAGRHDAAVTWEPFLSQAKASPRGHVLITTADPRLANVILSVFVGAAAPLDEKRDLVERFCRAWFESRDYALSHLEELGPYAKLVNMKPEDLRPALTEGIVVLDRTRFAALMQGTGTGSYEAIVRRAGAIYAREGVIGATPEPATLRDPACLGR